jgi:hypothetical protein
MASPTRWPRPITGLALILSASIFAACGGAAGGPAGPASSAGTEPSSAPASQPAAGTPAPTDQLEMSIALLPTASFNTSKAAVACDEAMLGTSASMTCDQIVALVARVASTMSSQPVTQIAVTQPADNPDAIQVTFWVPSAEGSGLTAFTSTINPVNQTVTFPVEDSQAVFPTAG